MMTNHHAERNTRIPPRGPIVRLALLTSVVMVATCSTTMGPTFDGRHLVGLLVGVTLSGFLLGLTMRRVIRRGEAVMAAITEEYEKKRLNQ